MSTLAADVPDIPCPDCKGRGGGGPEPSEGSVVHHDVWLVCLWCNGTGRFTPQTSDVPPPWFGNPQQEDRDGGRR